MIKASTTEKPEVHQQRIMEERQKKQEEIIRAVKKGSVLMVQTNDVEERDRYRYQWRKEDRQRIMSDRLELFVAVLTGVLMGVLSVCVEGVVQGVVMGALTGFVIWFTTGLVRNCWSP